MRSRQPCSSAANADAPLDVDQELMVRVRDDVPGAMGEFEHRWGLYVRNRLHHLIGNWHDAEELAQQVFLNVYRTRRRYAPCARIATWLTSVIRNAWRNELRERRSRPFSLARHHESLSIRDEAELIEKCRRPWMTWEDQFLFVEATANRSVEAIRFLLDSTPAAKRSRRGRALFHCLAHVLYIGIPPTPQLCSAFATTVSDAARRLALPLAAENLRHFRDGAAVLGQHVRTGNARRDLGACGFIAPRRQAFDWFTAAFVIEGAPALRDLRRSLQRHRIRVEISIDAYVRLHRAIRDVIGGNDLLRVIDDEVLRAIVRPIEEAVRVRPGNEIQRVAVMWDSTTARLAVHDTPAR
jgi:RNA polymerase sigma factor (sigma-70 family)